MSGQYNFVIKQGATFDKTLTWYDSKGCPIDVTGYTAAMQLRDKPGGATLHLNLSSVNGGIIVGTTDGIIRLFATDIATSALNFNTAAYDLELKSPAGAVTRLLEGSVTLSREVTI
jgi:hypothetical protein